MWWVRESVRVGRREGCQASAPAGEKKSSVKRRETVGIEQASEGAPNYSVAFVCLIEAYAGAKMGQGTLRQANGRDNCLEWALQDFRFNFCLVCSSTQFQGEGSPKGSQLRRWLCRGGRACPTFAAVPAVHAVHAG